jgi:hypothetical protein
MATSEMVDAWSLKRRDQHRVTPDRVKAVFDGESSGGKARNGAERAGGGGSQMVEGAKRRGATGIFGGAVAVAVSNRARETRVKGDAVFCPWSRDRAGGSREQHGKISSAALHSETIGQRWNHANIPPYLRNVETHLVVGEVVCSERAASKTKHSHLTDTRRH